MVKSYGEYLNEDNSQDKLGKENSANGKKAMKTRFIASGTCFLPIRI